MGDTNIEFEKDYGIPEGSPFWLVWNERGFSPKVKHPSKDDAEAEAARLARENPGREFHVLAVISTISTTLNVVGVRFDPKRAAKHPVEDLAPVQPPEVVAPEFKEVADPECAYAGPNHGPDACDVCFLPF